VSTGSSSSTCAWATRARRAGNVGPPVDLAQTTTAIEFNDLDALEQALATLAIACVLAEPARNGTQAQLASDPDLECYLHLHALNRGVLLTPFHNMALMAPTTTAADVDRHTEVFSTLGR
jgi:glutamate-1-semialdehyde 2,1-aminomutase